MKIRLQNLRKTYRDAGRELVIVDNLSFEFADGSSTAIVGRSGVGKSTLLHLIGGLDRASSGKVSYGDTDISQMGDDALSQFRGSNVGFIFQFHHLLPEFSALENVSMPLIIQGMTSGAAKDLAIRQLKLVGLADRAEHRPGELSGGEQQRVAIARALVSRPKVILADEPTGNLDHATAQEVQSCLFELQKEVGSTLIVVTHNSDLANSLGAAVEMLPGGQLSQNGAR